MSYDADPEARPVDPIPLREALRQTGPTASYPFVGLGQPQGFTYVGLGLAGEAGEVANEIKKITRDDGGFLTTERRRKILDELGDVMWYWLRMCAEMGFDPDAVVRANITKALDRLENRTLHGDTVNGHRVPSGLAGTRGEVFYPWPEGNRLVEGQYLPPGVDMQPVHTARSAEFVAEPAFTEGELDSLRLAQQRGGTFAGNQYFPPTTPPRQTREVFASKESAALALITMEEEPNGFTAFCRALRCRLLNNSWSFSDHSEDAVTERVWEHCEMYHVEATPRVQ